MATTRFFYGSSINSFLDESVEEIYAQLSLNSPHSDNPETKESWLAEIRILKNCLSRFRSRGSIFLEYNIPRMGRRADAIILIDGIIFILEFKTASSQFSSSARRQVWDYALDLKNFQLKSIDRTLIPIVVANGETQANVDIVAGTDNVYKPIEVVENDLEYTIDYILETVPKYEGHDSDESWAKGGYEPTPTIIEAAVALYNGHSVEEITKHDGNIDETYQCIQSIIQDCKQNNKKAICFVTGVPGAGKTLIGLQTAVQQFQDNEKAIYLSGNFPLVEVLQEALARDYVEKGNLEYLRTGDKSKKVTKKDARSKVKAFIQMIHHYRDTYLEGTIIQDGHIVPKPGYFESHKDKAYIPADHVAIFDEAQRAWTKEALHKFMKTKKGMDGFPYSEPAYLISCMDRQTDWGVIVCLIGGGQEINQGEAGMMEWINAINLYFPHWHVYLSSAINGLEYSENPIVETLTISENHIHIKEKLHLEVSMRSFRAEKVSLFVRQLLALDKEGSKETLSELDNYPIYLTRDLEKAKQWLKEKTRGSERCGLLASSKAFRLQAINVNVRYQPNFVNWFLENEPDYRSSNALEDTLTEFKVQGLEIDWAAIIWDADMRLNKKQDKWSHHELKNQSKWQNINAAIRQAYQINAYRVLLTRARQGMIIVVPTGDYSDPSDPTRCPEWYDGTYNYLKSVGIPEI